MLRAFDRGVTHFDLANNYGPPYGSAEEQFGRILAANLAPYRDELVVSSKAGYDMRPGPYGDGGSRKYLLNSLEASLDRMGLDYVDVFYSHRPDPETPIEETMGALATAVHQGKALYAGISNYGPEQTQAAIDALADEGVPLLIHQPRYNMFDRAPERGLFETLLDNGRRLDRLLAARRRPAHRTATCRARPRRARARPRAAGSPRTPSRDLPRARPRPERASRRRGASRSPSSPSPGCCGSRP